MRILKRLGCAVIVLALLLAVTALFVRAQGVQYALAWTVGGFAAPLPDTAAYQPATPEDCDSDAIMVLTYNTFNGSAFVESLVERFADGDLGGLPRWSERVPEIRERIAHYAPDLIGFQEMGANKDIAAIVPPEEDYTVVSYKLGRLEYGDSALLFRSQRFELLDSGQFWLTPTPALPLSFGFIRGSVFRYVNWAVLRDRNNGFTFLFVNTHFDNNNANKEPSSVLFREHFTALAESMPMIVTGDFNSRGDTERYARISGADREPPLLPNAWDWAPTDKRFYWRDGRAPVPIPEGNEDVAPATRIDHILVGGPCSVAVLDWTIDLRPLEDGRPISDHDLIAARIAFGSNGAAHAPPGVMAPSAAEP